MESRVDDDLQRRRIGTFGARRENSLRWACAWSACDRAAKSPAMSLAERSSEARDSPTTTILACNSARDRAHRRHDFDSPEARALSGVALLFCGCTFLFAAQTNQSKRRGTPRRLPRRPRQVEFEFSRAAGRRHRSAAPGEERESSRFVPVEVERSFRPRSSKTIGSSGGQRNHEPPEMEMAGLSRRAGLLAFSAFAAACYPAEESRDTFCLHLAELLIPLRSTLIPLREIVTAMPRSKAIRKADMARLARRCWKKSGRAPYKPTYISRVHCYRPAKSGAVVA